MLVQQPEGVLGPAGGEGVPRRRLEEGVRADDVRIQQDVGGEAAVRAAAVADPSSQGGGGEDGVEVGEEGRRDGWGGGG